MRAERRCCVAGADVEGYDGGFEVALLDVSVSV